MHPTLFKIRALYYANEDDINAIDGFEFYVTAMTAADAEREASRILAINPKAPKWYITASFAL